MTKENSVVDLLKAIDNIGVTAWIGAVGISDKN